MGRLLANSEVDIILENKQIMNIKMSFYKVVRAKSVEGYTWNISEIHN